MFKNPFKKRYSKWIPLGSHSFSDRDYVTFARKNINTGMLYFKTKKVQTHLYSNPFVPEDLIDTKKAWNILTGGWQ